MGKADPGTRKRLAITLVSSVLVLAALTGLAAWYSQPRNGFFVALAGSIGIGIYLAVRSPPKSRGRSGGDRIDFGR